MAIGSFGFALAVILLLVVVGAQNTDIVSYVCTSDVIPTGSPFFGTLLNLLVDLEQNTPLNGYDYKSSAAGSPTAYGHAFCYEFSESDCTSCLLSIGASIWSICNFATGAQVQLTDCFIRYEQYSF